MPEFDIQSIMDRFFQFGEMRGGFQALSERVGRLEGHAEHFVNKINELEADMDEQDGVIDELRAGVALLRAEVDSLKKPSHRERMRKIAPDAEV
jgi:uncharacterized coiled-coil protein SlyX